jgi:hypothetical protein
MQSPEPSPSDPHAREDGRPTRYRVATSQTGWRLPTELVREVQALARREQTRPGKLVTEMLKRHFGQGEHVWTAAELEARIRFPPGSLPR